MNEQLKTTTEQHGVHNRRIPKPKCLGKLGGQQVYCRDDDECFVVSSAYEREGHYGLELVSGKHGSGESCYVDIFGSSKEEFNSEKVDSIQDFIINNVDPSLLLKQLGQSDGSNRKYPKLMTIKFGNETLYCHVDCSRREATETEREMAKDVINEDDIPYVANAKAIHTARSTVAKMTQADRIQYLTRTEVN